MFTMASAQIVDGSTIPTTVKMTPTNNTEDQIFLGRLATKGAAVILPIIADLYYATGCSTTFEGIAAFGKDKRPNQGDFLTLTMLGVKAPNSTEVIDMDKYHAKVIEMHEANCKDK
ncbi:MAG: hypothetical protein PHW64_03255 [Sulfuricurvum sp.]|nr:hypothetical protein [Sulfuricurvum sp.]